MSVIVFLHITTHVILIGDVITTNQCQQVLTEMKETFGLLEIEVIKFPDFSRALLSVEVDYSAKISTTDLVLGNTTLGKIICMFYKVIMNK